MINIKLFYFSLPDASQLSALDKALERIAKKQEALGTGKRLWITSSPNHIYRPFLKARPFDMRVDSLSFSQSEIEEFRVSVGVAPKRRLSCSSQIDDRDSLGILLELALEIMQHTKAFLKLDDALARQLFEISAIEEEFPSQLLAHFPGNVYEVAHELADMGLSIVWLVDARWLRAYLFNKNQALNLGEERQDIACRFATLDYH